MRRKIILGFTMPGEAEAQTVIPEMLVLEKEAGYDFKTDFVALDRETFWQLASMAEEIKI